MEKQKKRINLMIISVGGAGVFLTNQHCRHPLVDTRASSVSLPYSAPTPPLPDTTRPKMKSPQHAFRPSPGVASPINNSLSLALQIKMRCRLRTHSRQTAKATLSELERVVTPGIERGRRRDAKRLSPWFCYSLLTWTPLVDANVNWGSTRVCSVTGVCGTRQRCHSRTGGGGGGGEIRIERADQICDEI